jgi:hypothetical protein
VLFRSRLRVKGESEVPLCCRVAVKDQGKRHLNCRRLEERYALGLRQNLRAAVQSSRLRVQGISANLKMQNENV